MLRPTAEIVTPLLSAPDDRSFQRFRAAYLALLEQRFDADRGAFDALADLARREDVFIGCNCPTGKQPDVRRCHTFLALGFLAERYPDVKITWPDA